MTPRKRIKTVLEGNKADRVPVDLWYTPEVGNCLKNRLGVADDFGIYEKLGLDKIVWVFPQYKGPVEAGSESIESLPHAATSRTMWGALLKTIKSGQEIYHERTHVPLQGYDSPESLADYPFWPDPDKVDYAGAVKLAKKALQTYATIGPWVSFFEIYCQMRGLEQSMMDLVLAPELVDSILDRIESIQTQIMHRFFEQASGSIDLCFVSDDMASQQSLIMASDLWVRFFETRMRRWCDLIHPYGMKVFYHSDGACEPLIDKLIGCGIDVLNPIQHVCQGMELKKLKQKYGHKVIFHGGVDNQSVLPFGSVEDVIKETKSCMKALGPDNKGYIVCSCHNIQAGTPVENILALVDTVKNQKA